MCTVQQTSTVAFSSVTYALQNDFIVVSQRQSLCAHSQNKREKNEGRKKEKEGIGRDI